MSATHLSWNGPMPDERRRATYLALTTPRRGAHAHDTARSHGRHVRTPDAHGLRDDAAFSPQTALACALGAAALHAALVWTWLHAPAPASKPLVTPPIALEMTAPPEPLPQAPKAASVAPPKPLPQARNTHPPRPRPAPTPTPTPLSSVPPPPAAPSPAPADTTVAAPPAAARAIASPAAEKTTLPDGNADYLRNPAPAYPAIAQDYGWQGKVVLHVHVLANGTPDLVELRSSSGHRVLDDAAVTAVRRWSFVPARHGTTPVDGWVDVPLNFQLD
ncbi:TonB family protein [Burkholderia contaminans]|nr:TonB family protein [Burkholderia contaminans]